MRYINLFWITTENITQHYLKDVIVLFLFILFIIEYDQTYVYDLNYKLIYCWQSMCNDNEIQKNSLSNEALTTSLAESQKGMH